MHHKHTQRRPSKAAMMQTFEALPSSSPLRVMAEVLVRVRPLTAREASSGGRCVAVSGGKVQVTPAGGASALAFEFDACWEEQASQEDVAKRVAHQVERVLGGYNASILMYGQSGTGKTYTMGTSHQAAQPSAEGLVPRLVSKLFASLPSAGSPGGESSSRVTLTIVEIYKERIRDLLCPSRDNLSIHEGERGTYVGDATQVEVLNPAEVLHWVGEALQSRAMGSTLLNADSSRSHLVLTLTVEVGSTVGKLLLVDLAGSEKVKRTGARGETLTEATAINKSLSALGNVIAALTSNAAAGDSNASAVVPYRDSKLTRLLKECLSGSAFTTLIVCVSPSVADAADTTSSLRFGARAKSLPCSPVAHSRDAGATQAAAVKVLVRGIQERDALIEALKERLAAAQPGGSIAALGGARGRGLTPNEALQTVLTWLLATLVARTHLWL